MIDPKDSRLQQLRDLMEIVANKINSDPGARDLAGLAKQYREILREIEEIKGSEPKDDEIAKLLGADGVPGSVR